MSTNTEPSNPSRSRRALLGGAALGAAALAVRGLSPEPVTAGQPALLLNSQDNVSDADTYVERGNVNVGLCGTTFAVVGNAHGAGQTGVSGTSGAPGGVGVSAISGGFVDATALWARGDAGDGLGYAVKAETKNGTALYGSAVFGDALNVQGIAVFSRAGVLKMSTGSASRTITLHGHGNYVTDVSFVVATIQGDVAGTWVRSCSVNVNANSFTVRLNKAAPKNLKVGWFVIN